MGRRTPVNVEVVVTDQSQVERMIKKFSRKVKKSGILDEVKKRRHFIKKSVKKRLKRKEKMITIKNIWKNRNHPADV